MLHFHITVNGYKYNGFHPMGKAPEQKKEVDAGCCQPLTISLKRSKS